MIEQLERNWITLSSAFSVTTTPTQVGSNPINTYDADLLVFNYLFTTPSGTPGQVEFRFYCQTEQDKTDGVHNILACPRITTGSASAGFFLQEIAGQGLYFSLTGLAASTAFRITFGVHPLGFPYIKPYISYSGSSGPAASSSTLKYRIVQNTISSYMAGGA